MNLIIIGPQGCGKGTQAKKLSLKYGIPHVSTGDIFRENIKHKTDLGILAEEIINQGKLVPDEITFNIIKKRLLEDDCKNGYILDGFPRNIEQADMLESFLETNFAININTKDKEAINRIAGRRTCINGHVYHLTLNPPKKVGVCDIDGKILFQRDDDKPETIRKRLKTYHEKTKPLIEHYTNLGKIIEINGEQPIEKVYKDIVKKLEK